MSNESGQSLIAAIVATTIAAGGLLLAAKTIQVSGKSQRNVQGKSDFTEMKDQTVMVLSSRQLCDQAFWDGESQNDRPDPHIAYFNPDDQNLPRDKRVATIKMGPSIVATVGGNIDVLKVSGIGIGEIDRRFRIEDGCGVTYLAMLHIDVATSNAYGAPTMAANFPFYVRTNSETHQITACARRLSDLECEGNGPRMVYSRSSTGVPALSAVEFAAAQDERLFIVNVGNAPAHDVYSTVGPSSPIANAASCEAYTASWPPGVACPTTIWSVGRRPTQGIVGVRYATSPGGTASVTQIAAVAD